MRNRFILLIVIAFNFIFMPVAFASNTVIIDSTNLSAEQINNIKLSIPLDLKPSFQSMTINVWDSNNVKSTKTVLFCKDMKGIIHWNNLCPDLIPAISPQALDKIILRADLPKYVPASEPKKTTQTIVIAIAALTMLGGGIKTLTLGKNNNFITSTDNSKPTTNLNQQNVSKETSGHTEKKPHQGFVKWSKKVSGPSPILTVILSDASYLRALLGRVAYLLYPLAIGVGYLASISAHKQALPPSLFFVILFSVFGILDAFTGLIISVTFISSILLAGNLTSFPAVLTVLGVCQVAIAPMLIAIGIRPLRREVKDTTSLWERITDFILASLLCGWAVESIIKALPGLAGVQLSITNHAELIGIWTAGLIFIRYSLQEIVTHFLPEKLDALTPEINQRKKKHLVLTMILKIIIFGIVAHSFIGLNFFFLVGLLMYAIPLTLGFVEHKFPKKSFIKKWSPKGVVGIVVMTAVGTSLGIIFHRHIQDARTYMLATFVLLSIPGFLLSILGLFGKKPEKVWHASNFGKIAYRVLGVIFFGLLLLTINGNNLLASFVK